MIIMSPRDRCIMVPKMTLADIKTKLRWRSLVGFVDGYFKQPIDEGSGNTSEEIAAVEAGLDIELPVAVREWFRLVGRRPDVTCAYDCSTQLDDLKLQNGFLSLYWESQMIWDCGIRAADHQLADPPAYFLSTDLDYVVDYGLPEGSVVHEGVVELAPTISSFLTNMAILQRLIGGYERNLAPEWQAGVYHGELPDWQTAARTAEKMMGPPLLEAPWGHSVYSWKGTFIDTRMGQYITNNRVAFDALRDT